MTKAHGNDKAEIPRYPLLQLHFQAMNSFPPAWDGKHLHEELLIIFSKIRGNFNNWDSNGLLLSLVILRCTFMIKNHMGEHLKKEN